MSKRKFVSTIKVVDPTPEEFVQAVCTAEKIVIASLAQKKETIDAGEALVFLAICTKAALIRSTHFEISDRELNQTVQHILSQSEYKPSPDFPYTKKQMAESLEVGK